ncbi:hypothetical protein R4Z09_08740 [Niallia oryzisoli]|uniref:Copper amine oxidase-like N-terminal domain-containing protein n=1 Tax=Niallia oryzisoli TaxID=1737571 RepID=A0ABZ2CGY4_9BACI
MHRKSIILLFFLLTITSGLLLWQWRSYSESTKENHEKKFEQVRQHIKIETAERELKITQTITGLMKDKEYQLVRPDKLFRWQCGCTSYNPDSNTILTAKGEVRFTFVIPIPDESAFLLTDWTANIQDVKIMETAIDIAEKGKRGSTWIAGIPQTGYEQLSFIDFYSFKGKGGTPSLYWQQDPLEKKSLNKSLFIFTDPTLAKNADFKSLTGIKPNEYIAVIFTDAVIPMMGQGIKVVSLGSRFEIIEREIIYSYYKEKLKQLDNQEYWIVDFLTALTAGTTPMVKKSEIMLAELSQHLTEDERRLFVQVVQQKKKLIDFQMLDQILGDIKGLKTSFFSINKDEKSEFISLLFMDARKFIINGNKTNIKIVYSNDKVLFPFIETLKAMGFEVETDGSTFYAKNKNEQYTFFLDQPIFQRNGTDFGLLENPLYVDNNQVYIKNKLLQSIFQVTIKENQQAIMLDDVSL